MISCQTAFLAAISDAIPIQLAPVSGQLFNALADLNNALEANSRKVTSLFQKTESLLAAILPPKLLEHIEEGESPLGFFSDLPFEWTLAGEWPICLSRPVFRIPLGLSHWDALNAIHERRLKIDTGKPERVLVFDLIHRTDPIRSYTDVFIAASAESAQHYTYSSPQTPREFVQALAQHAPDIVVLDTHASYDRGKDELRIGFGKTSATLKELVPDSLVPPLWILSACDTSVTGAVRGDFVRQLLSRGPLV
ncbi:MAG TPA: hypothetical protein VFE61_04095 [Candidatus Sulfotelmatobacter sp.]|jgi:hypothetical protein|nr:hypothetical protein [Candidatus Sulfotelmatobacter sp.]